MTAWPQHRTGWICASLVVLAACGVDTPGLGTDRATPQASDAAVSAAPQASQSALNERLRDASWGNDVERAADLIERGANVNAKDETIQSAYLIATSEGYIDLLELTLTHGAEVNDKDSWNGTGLIRAAERGHYLVVGRLLQADIDRDHVNRIGYQAIHEAVWFGEDTTAYLDTVRVLIAGGVELDRTSGTEDLTPVQMARERGFADLEATLFEARVGSVVADPDAALLRAARTGDADRAAGALRAGADIQTRDEMQRTPLLLAVDGGHDDVTRLLLALGAALEAEENAQSHPLGDFDGGTQR